MMSVGVRVSIPNGTSGHHVNHIQTDVNRASHLDCLPISMTLDQIGKQVLNGIKITALQHRPRRPRRSGNLDRLVAGSAAGAVTTPGVPELPDTRTAQCGLHKYLDQLISNQGRIRASDATATRKFVRRNHTTAAFTTETHWRHPNESTVGGRRRDHPGSPGGGECRS